MIKKALFDNIGLKIFSLAMACVLFIYIYFQEQTDASIGGEVKLMIRTPKNMMVSGDVVNTIRVTISGPWSTIRRFDPREIPLLEIDLRGFQEGPLSYNLPTNLIKLPAGLEVVSLNPSILNLVLEKVEERIFPIVPNIQGQVAEGYELKKYHLQPSKIKVAGSVKSLKELDYLITEPIDVTDLFMSFTRHVGLKLSRKGLYLKEKNPIELSVVIKEQMITKKVNDVPVLLVKELLELEYKPSVDIISLTLTGPRILLEHLDKKLISISASLPPKKKNKPYKLHKKMILNVMGLPDKVKIVGKVEEVLLEKNIKSEEKLDKNKQPDIKTKILDKQ